MKRLLYTTAILLAFTACHHQKNLAKSNAGDYTMQQTATTTTTVTSSTTVSSSTTVVTDSNMQIAVGSDTVATVISPGDTCRLVVQFISKGEGIDTQAQQDFDSWLKMRPEHINYIITHWGREGETNYCFSLNNLSTRQQDIFVRDARTFLSGKDLVIVNENAVCKGHL